VHSSANTLPETQYAVRCGKWKYRLPDGRRKKKKPAETEKKGAEEEQDKTLGELYDLAADIGEKNNLAAQNPDIVKRLKERIENFDRELKAGARPIGKIS